MRTFRQLLEDWTGDPVHTAATSAGLTAEPARSKGGYIISSWRGEYPGKLGDLIKHMTPALEGQGYEHRSKNAWGGGKDREHTHYYRHRDAGGGSGWGKQRYEINPPMHDVTVRKTGKSVHVERIEPTAERMEISRRYYEHPGGARVSSHNDGSIHHRQASGPTRSSVEAAHRDYLDAMGTDAAKEKTKAGGGIYSFPAEQHAGHWTKSWHHFRSDT